MLQEMHSKSVAITLASYTGDKMISYDRIDQWEQENDPTKEDFIAFLAGEDYIEEEIESILKSYGYN